MAMSVEHILELLESTSQEYRELSDSLVPPLRTVSMTNRVSSEVSLEVAAVLDRLIAKIRASDRS
jgi:Ni,Fe-hydrogenase maturation factor